MENKTDDIIVTLPKYNENLSEEAVKFFSEINWENTNRIEINRDDKPPYDKNKSIGNITSIIGFLFLIYLFGKAYDTFNTIWNVQTFVPAICLIGYASLLIENVKLTSMLDRIYKPNRYFRDKLKK